jgi:hypothetical protein
MKLIISHTEDQMAEATIGALSNLATAAAADRGVVAALTQAKARVAKQLEENLNELRDLKALLNQERIAKRDQRSFNPSATNYCWTHGFKLGESHVQNTKKTGHNHPPPGEYQMGGGGSQANKE